jgi:hypothetical protein
MGYTENRINIPFTIKSKEEGNEAPFAYVDHDLLSISGYWTANQAKGKFRRILTETLERALRALKHTDRRTFQTVQGDVFTVYWSALSDNWTYDISGPGRKWATSCPARQGATFGSALQQARQHAIDNFGGIAWE